MSEQDNSNATPETPATAAPAAESKPAPAQPAPPVNQEGPKRISIDKFFETELRVAKVVVAERIEGADKLLRLEVELGNEERRQIVAGIAKSYEPDALLGKRIIVVANLKPAKLRGVKSEGMLLAADLDGRPIVASFDEEIPAGTLVR